MEGHGLLLVMKKQAEILNRKQFMQGEIIAIGDELISGRILNETSAFAANRLFLAGYSIKKILTVGDDPEDIRDAIDKAIEDSSFVIVTGGLGPTSDDITSEVAARVFGKPLVRNEAIYQRILKNSARFHKSAALRMEKLSMLPEGAIPFNPSGCAAGFFINHKGVNFYFLPGVPSQMQKFLVEFVIPQLNKTLSYTAFMRQRVYKLFGLEEMEINVIIESLALKGVEVGYYPNFPEVHISVTARGEDKSEADKNFSSACSLIEQKFQKDVVAKDDETIEMTLGRLLMERDSRLALAESCTGGLIAHRITTVPGSSNWFERGIVCYSNQSKVDHLGVSPETLAASGAVSKATALEMAEGIKKVSGADFSLALTGIAGPAGGSPHKPVGTVFMAMSTPEKTVAGRFLFPGSRTMIQTLASETALDWLRRYLQYGSSEQKHFAMQSS